MSRGSRERRQRQRFAAPSKDPFRIYTGPSHPPHRSSFSFDWKPGEKELFLKKYGGAPQRVEDINTGPNRPKPSSS
jgi:hypothetical protein